MAERTRIAAFVLKYRLARETNSTYKIDVKRLPTRNAPFASSAAGLKNETHRPGACWSDRLFRRRELGFTRQHHASTAGTPEQGDAIERQNSRPDFQGLIYPGRSGDIQPAPIRPVSRPALTMTGRIISKRLAEAYLRFKKAGVPRNCTSIRAGADYGFGLRAQQSETSRANGSRALMEWLR